VDDEPTQLDSIRRGLFLFGYDAILSRSAEEAQVVFARDPTAVDVLVTDLTMPGSSGGELVRRLRQMRGDLPVVCITGLTMGPEVLELQSKGVLVVSKPFSPDELDRAIRGQLQRSPSSAT
jgi:DNA-binding response OmpR family regulator